MRPPHFGHCSASRRQARCRSSAGGEPARPVGAVGALRDGGVVVLLGIRRERGIGVIKHRAYGFYSAAALIAMICLCCSRVIVRLPM
jgi:hypothetical protein